MATMTKQRVYLYYHVYSVSNVSTATQTFDCFFYFRATWVHRGAFRTPTPESPDPFKRLGVESPQLMFVNAVHQDVALTDETVAEAHPKYRYFKGGDDDGSKVIEWKAKGRGTFRFRFDPSDFPYDAQLLTLVVSTSNASGLLELCEDVYDTTRSVARDAFHAEPGWDLAGDSKLAFLSARSTSLHSDDLKRRVLICEPFLTNQSAKLASSGAPKRYVDVLSIGVLIKRTQGSYFERKVLVPCFCVGICACLTLFALPRSSLFQRLAVIFASLACLSPATHVVDLELPRARLDTLCDLALKTTKRVLFGLFLGLLAHRAALKTYSSDGGKVASSSKRTVETAFVAAASLLVSFLYASLARTWATRRKRAGRDVVDIHAAANAASDAKALGEDDSELPDFFFPGKHERPGLVSVSKETKPKAEETSSTTQG